MTCSDKKTKVSDGGHGIDNSRVLRFWGASGIEKLKNERKYCEAFQAAAIRIERVLSEKILPPHIKKEAFIAFKGSITEEEKLKISESYKIPYFEVEEEAKKFFESKNCKKEAKIFVKQYLIGKSTFTKLRELCWKVGVLLENDNDDLVDFYKIRCRVIHQPSYLLDALTPDFPEGKIIEQEIIDALNKAIKFLETYDR